MLTYINTENLVNVIIISQSGNWYDKVQESVSEVSQNFHIQLSRKNVSTNSWN